MAVRAVVFDLDGLMFDVAALLHRLSLEALTARGAGAIAVGVPHEHSPAAALVAAHRIVPRLDDPALLNSTETVDLE